MSKIILDYYSLSLLLTFTVLTSIACACSPGEDAFWIVRQNEYTAQAARHLGVPVEAIEQKNPTMQPNLVLPGETYVVPYTSYLQAPATWSVTEVTRGGTSSCLAFLGLAEYTTATLETPGDEKPTTVAQTISPPGDSSCDSSPSLKPTHSPGSIDEIKSQSTEKEEPQQSNIPTKESTVTSLITTATETPEEHHISTSLVVLSPTPLLTTVEITKTLPPAEISELPIIFNNGQRYCYNGQEALSGTDETAYVATSQEFCELSRNPLNNADNRSFVRVMATENEAYPYALFSLFWNNLDSDCSRPDAAESDTTLCTSIMLDNFKQCNNGGKGGVIQINCIIYAYRPIDVQEEK